MLATLFPGIQHLQNIHPLLVHFPIAFLAGAAFFYGLSWAVRSPNLARTGFHLLLAGTLSAAAAAGTGLYAEEGVMIARSVREHLLEFHEGLMIATVCLSVVLSVWALAARPFPQRGRWGFILIFLGLLAVMSIGADFGARMVYDYNAGGNACPQPIEFTK